MTLSDFKAMQPRERDALCAERENAQLVAYYNEIGHRETAEYIRHICESGRNRAEWAHFEFVRQIIWCDEVTLK